MRLMAPNRRFATTPSVYAQTCAERLRRNPRDPDALFARAAFHAASGREAKAITILDDLSKIAPDYPGLWRFKARLYAESGDDEMAARCVMAADRQDAL